MKKLLASLLSIVMMFSLAGCSEDKKSADDENDGGGESVINDIIMPEPEYVIVDGNGAKVDDMLFYTDDGDLFKKDGDMFFSVEYDVGWSVLTDGEGVYYADGLDIMYTEAGVNNEAEIVLTEIPPQEIVDEIKEDFGFGEDDEFDPADEFWITILSVYQDRIFYSVSTIVDGAYGVIADMNTGEVLKVIEDYSVATGVGSGRYAVTNGIAGDAESTFDITIVDLKTLEVTMVEEYKTFHDAKITKDGFYYWSAKYTDGTCETSLKFYNFNKGTNEVVCNLGNIGAMYYSKLIGDKYAWYSDGDFIGSVNLKSGEVATVDLPGADITILNDEGESVYVASYDNSYSENASVYKVTGNSYEEFGTTSNVYNCFVYNEEIKTW